MMLPLHYEELVRGYRRADLLREATQHRLFAYSSASYVPDLVRTAVRNTICRLPLPVPAAVCAVRPV